jgi:hypothetical protein
MTTYAKKATFRRTPPYSWDASAPGNVAVHLKKSGVLADLTQSPGLLLLVVRQIRRVGAVRLTRLVRFVRQVGQVPGKTRLPGKTRVF